MSFFFVLAKKIKAPYAHFFQQGMAQTFLNLLLMQKNNYQNVNYQHKEEDLSKISQNPCKIKISQMIYL